MGQNPDGDGELSGKTPVAVEQDFQARIFMGTLTSALALPVHSTIEEKHRQDKHRCQINWTQALAKIRAIGVRLFVSSAQTERKRSFTFSLGRSPGSRADSAPCCPRATHRIV